MKTPRWSRRLRTRLFLSYVLVVAAGAATMLLVGTVVTRSVYGRQIRGFGLGRRQGRGQEISEQDLQTALNESLLPALLAGTLAALVVSTIVAGAVGRRLLRPIDELGAATRLMAAGEYTATVPVPAEIELASLADDVNALGTHLATTERRRSQLLAEVTHELRSPITVIQGHMEGLLDGVIEPSDKVYVAVAGEAARLQRLVEDLTTLSQADEGVLRIDPVLLDLADVASIAAERLRPQFEHVGVELVSDVAGSPLQSVGDRDRLAQVITNLLGNALGHTPSGGSVTVRSGRDDHHVWIDVIDTGTGIPHDELEQIFDRFFRGSAAVTRDGRSVRTGRGIGLTIARSLARAHGGDVEASSRGPGTGATFRLTIPSSGPSLYG